jgi:uncharacterized protein YbjT (DUF2867 family)
MGNRRAMKPKGGDEEMSQDSQKIAVVGATGRAGHHLVDVLAERGHEVVPMSRTYGVDVISGDGLADALVGVESIVDAATGPSPEQEAATEFFTTAARNLQEAGERAGVQRIIVVSIIKTDQLRGGYAVAKVAHERATLAGPSGAPGSTLEVAGPRPESLVEMAKLLVARRGNSLRVESVDDPVDGQANKSGVLLPGPDARLGGPTFDQWLDSVYGH